jgi:hypothetical protein
MPQTFSMIKTSGPWAGRGGTAQLFSRSDLLDDFAYALLALSSMLRFL